MVVVDDSNGQRKRRYIQNYTVCGQPIRDSSRQYNQYAMAKLIDSYNMLFYNRVYSLVARSMTKKYPTAINSWSLAGRQCWWCYQIKCIFVTNFGRVNCCPGGPAYVWFADFVAFTRRLELSLSNPWDSGGTVGTTDTSCVAAGGR